MALNGPMKSSRRPNTASMDRPGSSAAYRGGIHELPEQGLIGYCWWRKHVVGEASHMDV
jgi:hypothetical protein